MRRRALLPSATSASAAVATAGCVGTLQRPVDVRTYSPGNNAQ